MRVRAVVAYDGTCYGGFQRQANAPSVQGALEAALKDQPFTGEPPAIRQGTFVVIVVPKNQPAVFY